MQVALEFAIIGTSLYIAFGFIGALILAIIDIIKEKKKQENNNAE